MKIKQYRTQFIQELLSIYDLVEAESFFYLILEEEYQLKKIDLALNPDLTFSGDDILKWKSILQELKKEVPNLVICGDYNICHEAIDIHDPIRNKKVSGFLPEERAWLDGFMKSGFIDSFRFLNKEPGNYTWWTMRFPSARLENKGWRIDYCLVSEPLKQKIKRAVILPEAKHSDHCPSMVEID